MLDPPSEDVTAHVLEMLAGLGRGTGDPVVLGGLRYLAREQRASGSWYGRWGVNHVYGTWCVISALTALGCGGPHLPRAVRWLLQAQNRDGGWGETCHSYEDESFAGVGVSTASQTAWAVMALQRSGHGEHSACRRGLAFLRDRQQAGTWPEPEYTGTGFPGDFYLNYGMYRHLFPTMALAMDGGLGASGELRGARVERRPADQPAADQLLERNASPSNVVEVAGRTAAGPPSESPASHPDRED